MLGPADLGEVSAPSSPDLGYSLTRCPAYTRGATEPQPQFPELTPCVLPNLSSLLVPDNGQVHPVPPGPLKPKSQRDQEQLRFSQGMSLCVCYSASIGGIATLTGTTPNLVLQGQVNE